MKTVAIISEYNPFHTGHEYQIIKIREEFGADTRLVAIMSGNFTERAETAVLEKYKRAECAVKSGIDLVLELPFPFSSSSAEFFAKSGVFIANSLGVIDVLSFGSECGCINVLKSVANKTQTQEYIDNLLKLTSDKSNSSLGYPKLCEIAYKGTFSNDASFDFSSSNNILALEYIKALNALSSNIKPHTIKRFGAAYSEENITDLHHQSATAIRNSSLKDAHSALEFLPESSRCVISDEIDKGAYPCDMEKLSTAVISHFRLNPPTPYFDIHDAKDGIYNRIYTQSFNTNSLNELIKLCGTKKYTTSRIRRAILNSYLGVTSSMVSELPLYTQVLGMNGVGKSILKDIKKKGSFPVITKAASYDHLSPEAKQQKEFSDRADFIFQLTRPSFEMGNISIKTSPFVSD